MTFVPGEDGVVTDFVIEVTAGEDLSTNDAVYIDTSDGEAYKCDADDLSKIAFAGFVVATATNGNTVRILPWGIKGGFTSLTVNAIYYLSGTAGEITATKPSNYKMVAKALTATTVRIITEPTVRKRIYTSSDTWTKPAGLLKVEIEVVGGGANGTTVGGDGGGAGGGAGGYSKKTIYAGDLGSTETVTVGAVAGTSSFGSHVTCTGASSATGGTATGGDINIDGQHGEQPTDDSNSSSQTGFGGSGGSNPLGFGGARDSQASTGYGSGGAGNDEGGSGGAGTQGIVIVTEYY